MGRKIAFFCVDLFIRLIVVSAVALFLSWYYSNDDLVACYFVALAFNAMWLIPLSAYKFAKEHG